MCSIALRELFHYALELVVRPNRNLCLLLPLLLHVVIVEVKLYHQTKLNLTRSIASL